ncbi:MAG: hypothetical protein JST40_13825 [Armatimonadetes bacterium]|nr:hypothetical protein [Armatimonadota bacterium]
MAISSQSTVQALIDADQRVHAVLLYGSDDAIREGLARRLAQGWLCTSEALRPCGECDSCRAFEKGNSLDLRDVSPSGPQNLIRLQSIAEPSTRDPGDTTQPISEFVQRPPYKARRKVVLIHDADRMNSAAANALLKMLEEPLPRVAMILTVAAVGSVLPTILSRCLCVACASPSELDIANEMEQVLADGTQGRLDAVRSKTEFYTSLWSVFQNIERAPASAGLGIAEKFRAVASLYGGEQVPARVIQAEMLHSLGLWVRNTWPADVEARRLVAEAHRRVVGNVDFAIATDPMFCRLLVNANNSELSSRRQV